MYLLNMTSKVLVTLEKDILEAWRGQSLAAKDKVHGGVRKGVTNRFNSFRWCRQSRMMAARGSGR